MGTPILRQKRELSRFYIYIYISEDRSNDRQGFDLYVIVVLLRFMVLLVPPLQSTVADNDNPGLNFDMQMSLTPRGVKTV